MVDHTAQYSNPEAYANREQGVYLLLVHNDSDLEVFDRNGDGRLLVRQRAFMLKSGKFEGGLAARMHQNYAHFHRRKPDGAEEPGIFPSMLKLLLVHFVSSDQQLRSMETTLNRAVRNLLAERGLDESDQTWHSESRRIRGTLPPALEDLDTFFRRVVAQ